MAADGDRDPVCACVSTPAGPIAVIELNDAGWKALHDGYSDKAAKLFAEALTPVPTIRPDGAGAAAHERGNQKDAMARLTRALELNPA
jgi:hypothetical protein